LKPSNNLKDHCQVQIFFTYLDVELRDDGVPNSYLILYVETFDVISTFLIISWTANFFNSLSVN